MKHTFPLQVSLFTAEALLRHNGECTCSRQPPSLGTRNLHRKWGSSILPCLVKF